MVLGVYEEAGILHNSYIGTIIEGMKIRRLKSEYGETCNW